MKSSIIRRCEICIHYFLMIAMTFILGSILSRVIDIQSELIRQNNNITEISGYLKMSEVTIE